jgi:protein-disulfide isomerase
MKPKMVSAYVVSAASLFVLSSVGVLGGLPSYADSLVPTADRYAFTDEQKEDLGHIIRNYLIEHPEMLLEMQQALDEKQKKEQSAKISALVAEIAKAPDNSIAGRTDGDVTVVEFFDFNCEFCKRGLPQVQQLIRNDNRLRFIFMDLPFKAKGSEEAARVALAAKRQGRYWEFHQAMLSNKGPANEASALRVAGALSLDMGRLKSDMMSDAVKGELNRAKLLAENIGVLGTPHFLVGDKSFVGAPEDLQGRLESIANDLRKNGCINC